MVSNKLTIADLEAYTLSRQLGLDDYLALYVRAEKDAVIRLVDHPDDAKPLPKHYVWNAAHYEAGKRIIYAGAPSWGALRKLIYERDQGRCWLCLGHVSFEAYHIGHLVDRMCGGTDLPYNLAAMHAYCNVYLKPLHNTLEEAETWREEYHERMTLLKAS